MADFNNINGGLKIASQIPLDVKRFSLNESVLSDLGTNDNLAFTYYEGLKVYCFQEKTTYVWREVESGEENTGLVTTDFTYPLNTITFGIDYSGRVFNFFPTGIDITIDNIGSGAQILTSTDQAYHLRTLLSGNLGTLGTSLLGGFTQNTNDISLLIRLINSKTLTLSIGGGGELNIDLPETSTIPGLYVNNKYIPSYADFQAGITKGNGSLSKPFTDTISYSNSTTYTITPNTSIQNALDAYVGSGTVLLPELSGQKIIIQNNETNYIFSGTFNYSFLNIFNQGAILSTNSGYLVNMDDNTKFNATNSSLIITNDVDANITIQGLGFLNSGNVNSGSTYATGRILQLNGGLFYENQTYDSNKYLLNSDPTGSYNGSTGANNDGNICISINNCRLFSLNNGLIKIGGKSKIELNNCEQQSSVAGGTVNINLKPILQSGGLLRIFDSEISFNGSKTAAITFSPTSTFQAYTQFIVKNTRFSGTATTWFNKTTSFLVDFNVDNCISLYFSATQLFNSTDLWSISFNGNSFENTTIDFTKVDLTLGNNKSSINTIGNNIIETLVKYSSRAVASGFLPVGSAFINTNGMPINLPDDSWKRDIVIVEA